MQTPTIPAAARRAIIKGVYADDPAANLEYLGLSPRILTLLEESRFHIMTLEDLLLCSRDDLLSIPAVGEKSLEQILHCLSRYDRLKRAEQRVRPAFATPSTEMCVTA